MSAAVYSMLMGVGAELDATIENLKTDATQAFVLVPALLSKKMKGQDILAHDTMKILEATLDVRAKDASAQIAKLTQQKNVDSAEVDKDTSGCEALIENLKSDLQVGGTQAATLSATQDPINGIMKQIESFIKQIR